MNHGTKIAKKLVLPWAHTDRGLCANLYFAPVSCAEEMMQISFCFIGVVKTATKKSLMQYLSRVELEEEREGRGQRVRVMRNEEGRPPNMMSFVWVDRERRYFISTASTLKDGVPYSQTCWRQPGYNEDEEEEDKDNNVEAEQQELTVPQPEACEIFYDTCTAIDCHNCCRQQVLQMEKKLQTKSRDKRVCTTIFSVYVVDAWLIHKGCITNCTHPQPQLTRAEFHCQLAEELIDNNHDRVTTRKQNHLPRDSSSSDRSSPNYVNARTVTFMTYPVLRATKQRKLNQNGKQLSLLS